MGNNIMTNDADFTRNLRKRDINTPENWPTVAYNLLNKETSHTKLKVSEQNNNKVITASTSEKRLLTIQKKAISSKVQVIFNIIASISSLLTTFVLISFHSCKKLASYVLHKTFVSIPGASFFIVIGAIAATIVATLTKRFIHFFVTKYNSKLFHKFFTVLENNNPVPTHTSSAGSGTEFQSNDKNSIANDAAFAGC